MANGSDDDDYLSDKFLVSTAQPQKPKTYSEKRKEVLVKSHLKNEQNRTKSRRQLELETREEGLSKSLFERAEDDKTSGRGSENKALSMMMKMGFKPGQALGVTAHDEDNTNRTSSPPPPSADSTPKPQRDISPPQETFIAQPERQLVNPLPLNEWSGRKGIGLGKRGPSPNELERLAKAAKIAEDTEKESYRDRTRREFEQRRAEARLASAQQTCASLDERAEKEFNVFWLDPTNPESFPPGLMDALSEGVTLAWRGDSSMEERLRTQMQADMLVPLDDDGNFSKNVDSKSAPWAPETIEVAAQFLCLNPVERLSRVLQYLRAEYHYCFWCGTQYRSADEMAEECPGPDEDMHD